MNERSSNNNPVNSAAELFAQMARMTAENQRVWLESMRRTTPDQRPEESEQPTDPAATVAAGLSNWGDLMTRLRQNPERLAAAQIELWQGYQQLFLQTTRHLMGQDSEAAISAHSGDRRFRDPEWENNPLFSFLKQSYLLNAEWLRNALSSIEGLDPDEAQRLDFYARQFIDAVAPTNFALTNPEVLREATESKGESLTRGINNLAEDLKRGDGQLAISQVDTEAFEVGENIAVTPGKVIYQNELMQLIQYAPTTEQVYKKPLLIIPPWINKFYVLDLRPENSFVKWCTDQGYTTFLISWVNPDASLADKGFEDYMTEGVLAALDAIEQATGEKRVNALGYCIGGTLLAATQAYMAATEDERIAAATYLTAQVDFSEAGELRVFTDKATVDSLESQVRKQGYLDGASMAWSFNMMRANDLIWSFVVNNYLMGKEPPAFDLLYWNSDSTRLPAEMWSFYIRKMYQENLLAKPGGIELAGVPIDLGAIRTPVYFQATREDHIAPFRSVFKGTRLFGGPTRFVLAGSGHIAGVINPPAKGKYPYWVNNRRKQYTDADAWLADAEEQPGSWWPNLHTWLRPKSGKKVPARHPGDGDLTPIEDAPGSYVRVKS